MDSKHTASEQASSSTPNPNGVKASVLFFLSGASAGLIIFALFGGIWQVNHFGWVMAAVSLSSGVLAAIFRKNFQDMLNALLDDAPPI